MSSPEYHPRMEKGDESYPSREEVAYFQRILRHPEVLPEQFWRAVIQKVALNGEPIPQSQVQGLATFSVAANKTPATGDAGQSITSTSYTDLATVGPTLQVGSGKYILMYGAHILPGANNEGGAMSPSIAGAAATDADSCSYATDVLNLGSSVMRALVTDLPNASNTITAKYRTINGGSVTFYRRFLIAVRYGNA